jgi:homoserine dehydrogenase
MANAAMKPLNVGVLGFGTVGRGTWDVLRRNEEEITRAGRPADSHQLDRDAHAGSRARRDGAASPASI